MPGVVRVSGAERPVQDVAVQGEEAWDHMEPDHEHGDSLWIQLHHAADLSLGLLTEPVQQGQVLGCQVGDLIDRGVSRHEKHMIGGL